MSGTVTALILAGRRRGETDTVAAAAGVSCKAFAAIGGTPMVERVLAALSQTPEIGTVRLILPDGLPLSGEVPRLAAALQRGEIGRLPAGDSPAQSILSALDHLEPRAPLLITTADHALLTPAMLHIFLAGAAGAGAAAAVVPLNVLAAKYPGLRRTRLAFRDGAYKGANLFYFAEAESARPVIDFWRRLEDLRKQPWRMARALGPAFLLRYALRRLTLDDAIAHLGRRTGMPLRAVRLPVAEAALDVDSVDDLEFIRQIAAGFDSGPAPIHHGA